MTDYPDQPGFLDTQPPLDEMMLYDGVDCATMEMPTIPINSPKHFAFSHQEVHPVEGENMAGCDEGVQAHYIPHSFEHGIHSMQASSEQQFAAYQSPFTRETNQQAPKHSFFQHPPSTSQPSPSTMTEFFQLMSQPENVQAYMQFLQNQHDTATQQAPVPPPTRSRSNSQPAVSNFPTTAASRTSWPESTTDNASSRERKIAKYRTKRARRLTGSAQVPADSCSLSTSAPSNDMADMQHYMPAPKIQKTLTRDLETRLMSSEEEVRMLQSALASREAELQLLRQAFDDQQRQIALSIYGDTSSNPSSSACTSPRPRSPSTPAMVSSPSSVSIGSSTMDTEFGSMDTSSMGSSEHMMDMIAAQKRQEKLKKLGGPPSDVYHPWWHGISLNHPAFQEKEDWANVELRPHQDLLARERLNYLLNMQRFKMEQSRLASEQQQHIPMGSTVPHPHMSHPYTHQPPAFYQSPHQSHIQTGSPVHAGGYWSGHFAPNTPEKIDFSKISLRKTSSEAPPTQQHSPAAFGRSLSMSTPAAPPPATSPVSPLQMPVSPHQQPHHPLQASPTAAIWRDAMAHPEMHGFPQHLSWIQEQPELQHRMQLHPQPHRAPFRRQTPLPASAMPSTTISNRLSPRGTSVISPRAAASSSSTAMDC